MAARNNPPVTVSDYVTLQRGNTYSGKLVGVPGPALLGLGSIEPGGGFRHGKFKSFGGECPPKIMLQPGNLYVALKGATKDGSMVGSIARLPSTISSGRLTQDTARLDFFDSNPEIASHLYWVLRTPQYRQYCDGCVTGSASASFSREDFLSYSLPPITNTTKTLVNIFEAIEAKIDLNRRMNETLETMARAIFRDWFVDFGPTQTKMEGRAPYLAPEIWALFPDRLDDEGKPEGWKLGRLDDLVILQRGFDLPTEKRTPGQYVVMAASGPNGNHDQFMVVGPGVTTGRSGVLGRVFLIHENFWPLNTSLWVKEFKFSTPLHAYFLLQHLDVGSFNAGSAVPTLNRNHIHNLAVPIPSRELIEKFDDVGMPLFRRIRANEGESSTLAATRDLLLPKLMSGEIRVKDAEQIAEAVL